jgi:tRNA modification GTPase
MLNESTTIAAISTAKGVGGIGVVRVSGKRALEIAKNICKADLSPRKVEFTSFKDKKNVTLDQASLYIFHLLVLLRVKISLNFKAMVALWF